MGELADGGCDRLSGGRCGIVVGNAVVELFRLDRGRIGALALFDSGAGDLERGVGDVQGEGGERLLLGWDFLREIGEIDGF